MPPSTKKIRIFSFSWRDLAIFCALFGSAVLLCILLHMASSSEGFAYSIFILTVLLISRFTTGYLFGTAELLARVRTAIRHTRTTSPTGEIAQRGTYSVGEMVIDYNKHQVLVRGENVRLTLSEFRIVALLGKFAGKVLTYDYIIKELWGPRAGGDNQILRVNMANIRRKIEKNPAEPEYLFTEVGVGYRMAENPSGE